MDKPKLRLILLFLVAQTVASCRAPQIESGQKTVVRAKNPGANQIAAPHPLDDLSADEVLTTTKAVQASGRFSSNARFAIVMAKEPDKHAVLSGSAKGRQAFVALYEQEKRELWEVVVDLPDAKISDAKISDAKKIDQAEPPLFLEEYDEMQALVRADKRWQSAMEKRGITNFDDVQVDGWAPGLLSPEERASKARLMRGLSYYKKGLSNFYARPIEGVVAVVDMNAKKVVEVLDYESVPIASGSQDFTEAANSPVRRSLKPLVMQMPEGPSYSIRGQEIEWQGFKFRYSMQPMKGLVLYDVRFTEKGQERPVAYAMALSEMVVPYGDPGKSWSFRNAFDVGEYGIGRTAHSLVPDADAPSYATFFDAHFASDHGENLEIPNAVAVYERRSGILWKHRDTSTLANHGRVGRELVVTFMTTVGNYDYGVSYIFHLDGVITVEASLTGILLAKGTPNDKNPCHTECLQMVEKNILAPPHQHFFAFRLDLDVDGRQNSVMEVDAVADPVGPNNPDANSFSLRKRLIKSELDGVGDMDITKHRMWKVYNRDVNNALGHPTGYAIVPGHNGAPYISAESPIRQRAQFVNHHIWFTQHHDREIDAAGPYPNQGPTGDGLPKMISNNESLEKADVVAWYVLGVTHFPRPEEWPIMNVHKANFSIMPYNFFARNPAMDLPEAIPQSK